MVPPPPPPSPDISIGGLQEPLADLADLPERARTPPAVRDLTSNFERHPVLEAPLLGKRPCRARVPGGLASANSADPGDEFVVSRAENPHGRTYCKRADADK